MTANLERQLFRAGAAYPFLRQPLERVERVTDGDVRGLGTDGAAIYYDPNASPPPGAAEHLLLHCIFRHLLVPENAVRPLWDLACDLAAEYLRGDFFPTGESRLNQRVIADALPEQTDPRVAAQVYRALLLILQKVAADKIGVGDIHRNNVFLLKLLRSVTLKQKSISAWQLVAVEHICVLAHISQKTAQRKARAERISVGTFVRKYRKIIVC